MKKQTITNTTKNKKNMRMYNKVLASFEAVSEAEHTAALEHAAVVEFGAGALGLFVESSFAPPTRPHALHRPVQLSRDSMYQLASTPRALPQV